MSYLRFILRGGNFVFTCSSWSASSKSLLRLSWRLSSSARWDFGGDTYPFSLCSATLLQEVANDNFECDEHLEDDVITVVGSSTDVGDSLSASFDGLVPCDTSNPTIRFVGCCTALSCSARDGRHASRFSTEDMGEESVLDWKFGKKAV
jgi:hypothetical protein